MELYNSKTIQKTPNRLSAEVASIVRLVGRDLLSMQTNSWSGSGQSLLGLDCVCVGGGGKGGFFNKFGLCRCEYLPAFSVR